MSIKTLRTNGYGVDDAGRVICFRDSETGRYSHEQLAVIRLDMSDAKNAAAFVAKVIAAVAEPGAVVGTNRTGAVMVFQFKGFRPPMADASDDRKTRHDFIFDGKQCALVAASEGEVVDVPAFTWADGRSPLSVHRSLVAPLFDDVAQRAHAAVTANGGRFGTLAAEANHAAANAAQAERIARIRSNLVERVHVTHELVSGSESASAIDDAEPVTKSDAVRELRDLGFV